MKAGDLINLHIRDLIGDRVAPYAISDATILFHMNATLADLFSKRPEAFFVTSIVTTPPSEIDDVQSTLPIRDIYAPTLAHGTAARLFMLNTEDANNVALSEKNMAVYLAGVMT